MATDKEIQQYLHITNINMARDLLVERDKEYLTISNENDELKMKIKELKEVNRQYSIFKKTIDKKIEKRDLSKVEVYSSDIITTVLDFIDFDKTEDEEIEYFKLPNKQIANEMLIDNGYAMCELKVRIHLEIIK